MMSDPSSGITSEVAKRRMAVLLRQLHLQSISLKYDWEVIDLIERLLSENHIRISEFRIVEIFKYYKEVICFSVEFRLKSIPSLRSKIKARKLVIAGWRKKF